MSGGVPLSERVPGWVEYVWEVIILAHRRAIPGTHRILFELV